MGILLKNGGGKKGFTIIEALVLLFIFVMIVTTFYRFFASGTVLMIDIKKKLVALNVANERIEFVRSLAYGEIEIGPKIDDSEIVSRGGYDFNLITSIEYHDDEYDNDGGDDSPNDYKKVNVSVSWGGGASNQTVLLSSIVAPFGEEVEIGGGILNISAIDIDGSPVSGVDVHVVNSLLSYDRHFLTNLNGAVSIIGAVQSNQKYVITLSKSNYEVDVVTLPPYPTTSYYPTNVHASVVDGSTTNSVFSFSRTSGFKIKFINPVDETAVPDVNFAMEGGRVIGTNADTSLVHNYVENSLVSNSSGEESIADVSPGQYTLTVNEPGYVFWKTDAGSGNNSNEILISQGESGETKSVWLLGESVDSYFVKVNDAVTGSPLEDVSVEISSTPLSFSDSLATDEYGYAFSPAKSDPLKIFVSGAVYDLEISKTGYQTVTKTVTIDGLTPETVELNPL